MRIFSKRWAHTVFKTFFLPVALQIWFISRQCNYSLRFRKGRRRDKWMVWPHTPSSSSEKWIDSWFLQPRRIALLDQLQHRTAKRSTQRKTNWIFGIQSHLLRAKRRSETITATCTWIIKACDYLNGHSIDSGQTMINWSMDQYVFHALDLSLGVSSHCAAVIEILNLITN